jgi:hypothetical protein
MAHFLRGVSSLIVTTGFVIVVSVFVVQYDILINTLNITTFLKIPDLSFLGFTQGVPGVSILTATEILYIGYIIALFVLVIFSFALVATVFQELADFADPPKAINKLEERISALRKRCATNHKMRRHHPEKDVKPDSIVKQRIRLNNQIVMKFLLRSFSIWVMVILLRQT